MLINYHFTGAERKRLVKTIASYTGCDAKYPGVPSCAYRVDCFTIDREVENGKYTFRCFLLRLGFIGDEYKQSRKILLSKFEGSSSYKSVKEAE